MLYLRHLSATALTPLEAAEWAKLAYENEVTGREFAEKRGFSFVLFSVGTHQFIVVSNDCKTIVAFRGTQFWKVRDWWASFNARQIRNKAGKGMVHQGYHNAAWKLIPIFRALLKGEVYFVGHSLGGAIATQVAGILKTGKVFTFNATKTGDADYAANYPAQHFRFVSATDLIQSFPADTEEWAHVGNKITLDSKGHSMDDIVRVLRWSQQVE